MCDGHSHQQDNTLDPLSEFLAQLLADIPDVLPTPIATPTFPSVSPSTSASISTPTSAPYHAHYFHLNCQWVSPNDPTLVCNAPLSQDRKLACEHLRCTHDVRGNEKAYINCRWRDCNVPPMRRGSLKRHVLAVHLGLLRWECELCGRVFSRKGTSHTCVEGG